MLDEYGLIDVIDSATYRRGVAYFEAGRAHDIYHAVDTGEIAGHVQGSAGADYATLVSYLFDDSDLLDDFEGRCQCPMSFNCKHAVALFLAALDMSEPAAVEPESLTPAIWEQSLGRMVDLPNPQNLAVEPLALAFELVPPTRPTTIGRYTSPGSPARVEMRPVRMGQRGRWVRTGISWAGLSDVYAAEGFDPEHVRLLRAIAGADPVFMSWRHGPSQPWMQLGAARNPMIWDLLADAINAGISLISSDKSQSPIRLDPDGAHFELEIDRSPGGLTVAPLLTVGGVRCDSQNVLFLGEPVHGLATWRDTKGVPSQLTLARFAHRIDPESPGIFTSGPVHIPASDERRFVQTYLPALRQRHRLIIPGEGFASPERRPPVLKLVLHPLPEHRLNLQWHWVYRVGDQSSELPLRPTPTDRRQRDNSEEARVLKLVVEAAFGFDELLVPTPAGPSLRERAITSAEQTVGVVTALLPALRQVAEVEIDGEGDLLDYREALSAPAVGLSSVPASGSTDWFDLTVTVTVDGQQVPFDRLFYALATDQEVMILDDGTYFSLLLPELQQLRTLIEEARALSDKPNALRISRFQVALWEELEALGVADAQSHAWTDQVRAWRDPQDQHEAVLPDGLTATLRDYQVDGYAWLNLLRRNGLGGILADDMGLGKTVQTLAMIAQARAESPGSAPYLVVAPTSVMGNWQSEAARFVPALRTTIISATASRRGNTLIQAVSDADIVITSYTLLRLEAQEYQQVAFSGLILDEAQAVKNHQSKVFGCIKRMPVPFKLAITGTPMENNLMELWSLFSIVAPGLFPHPTRFNDFYRTPIEKSGDADMLGRLRRRIRPLMLRRTKEQVAVDLPAKQEQVLEVALEPDHRRIYQQYLQRERQKILGLIDDMDGNRFAIFRSLTLLRQASIDPALVGAEYDHIDSTKMNVLLDLLRDIVSGGHRTLVFSQFTRFLHRVRDRLDAEGIEYVYLDGSTTNRPKVLSEFKTGTAPVFLVSLKAGGVGLNLTEADYCILLDPWWNPATEAQAVDRIHRIGQQRNVMVYRLVSKDTIEEKVMALKAGKAKLFASVMSEDGVGGKAITAADIRELLA